MIITITGHPGSGKTTVGRIVAEKLNYKFVSIGCIRGEMAQKKGITIQELNKIGEKEPWTDKEADEKLKKLAKKGNTVFDARLGFFFIPDSIKIFLDVSPEEGAKRIMGSSRPDEVIEKTIAEQIVLMKERTESDNRRYLKYYSTKFDNKKKFDYWLDTSGFSIEQVVEKVMDFVKQHSAIV